MVFLAHRYCWCLCGIKELGIADVWDNDVPGIVSVLPCVDPNFCEHHSAKGRYDIAVHVLFRMDETGNDLMTSVVPPAQ